MIRYSGQPLHPSASIAVIANDAIGNFVIATPLLQMLRATHAPARLAYFGGTRTRELQNASDLFDDSFELHGATADAVRAMLARRGTFDLIVNIESTAYSRTMAGLLAGDATFVAGPCIGPGGRGDLAFGDDARGDLWRDTEWIAGDLRARYPFLRSAFIGEIFARLCYLDGAMPGYRVPSAPPRRAVPSILIATAASLPQKLWPGASWRAALEAANRAGHRAGLLGAPPKEQAEHWRGASLEDELVRDGLVEDLRGVFTLPEVVGALAAAQRVLTLDNGILHLAVAAGAPTVGLFRHGIHRLWAPPSPTLTVLTPGEGRDVADIPVSAAVAALALA